MTPNARPGGSCWWWLGLAAVPVLAAIAALGMTSSPGRPWALLRSFTALHNPPWAAGRWRGGEHAEATFNQWWYLMVTDLETNDTWSMGIGGFRSGRKGVPGHAGGWIKVKRGAGGPAASLPRFTVPFGNLEADGALNVRVWRDATGREADADAALRVDVIDDSTLRIRASLGTPGSSSGSDGDGGGYSSGADIVLSRVHGVFGKDVAEPEECRVANVPFAYASTAVGRFWIGAGDGGSGSLSVDEEAAALGGGASVTMSPSDGHRFRAYLETTWGCTFPSPPEGGDPLAYPWKWMWAVVPSEDPKRASDVGVLVNHARLAVPLAPGILPSMDVQGTFAFFDLPGGVRVAAVNVTLFDSSALPLQLQLASPAPEELLEASLSHADFQHFEDEHGSATLPLEQTLVLRTTAHAAVIAYRSRAADYVRIAVPYEAPPPPGSPNSSGAETVTRVVSDFRASFSDAYIIVTRRGTPQSPGGGRVGGGRYTGPPDLAARARGLLPQGFEDVLFEGWAPHNGLEFAYQAPFAAS